jgi:uridine kinase
VAINQAVETIRRVRARVPAARAALIAVSGIDASGKGQVTARLAEALEATRLRTAVLGVDGWLHLPAVRFDPARPAERFYQCAIRFDEMFRTLVLPFRAARACRLDAWFTDETADSYRPYRYEFGDTDVILLEGIFLLKPAFRGYYDASYWVDCTFETALERAVRRGQEGLPPAETVRAFHTIYFPAQRLHLAKDAPRAAANAILVNDPRLADLDAGGD